MTQKVADHAAYTAGTTATSVVNQSLRCTGTEGCAVVFHCAGVVRLH